MLVRMTEDAEGSVDGISPTQFEEGKTYEVPPILGQTFIDTDRAVAAERTPDDPADDEAGEEEETVDKVTKEPTSEGSPWYQFREPNGDLITELEDGEETPIKVMGEERAEEKRQELTDFFGDAE